MRRDAEFSQLVQAYEDLRAAYARLQDLYDLEREHSRVLSEVIETLAWHAAAHVRRMGEEMPSGVDWDSDGH